MNGKKDVIIALDFPTGRDALNFLDGLSGERPFVKVGMELYYREGPAIIRNLKDRGHRIFLDLKLHDIPNTVRSAMRVLAGLGVDMVNVHAAGTIPMMKAALAGLMEGSPAGNRPLLIAVTQLTSTDAAHLKEDILIDHPMEEVVLSYAENAKKAGLDGVVCSPLESPLIHGKIGNDFLTVTPGVRFAGEGTQDQSRVTTPKKAGELGSDFIVVGRSITRADDPAAAYRRAVSEFIGG